MRGVPVLLEELSSRDDTVLGILTGNFERAAFLKLAHFGLRAYFQLGGYGDHHESRDDVARAARQAVNAQLRDRHPSWQLGVVGDTPRDVQCARAIGARVVRSGAALPRSRIWPPRSPITSSGTWRIPRASLACWEGSVEFDGAATVSLHVISAGDPNWVARKSAGERH